MTEQTTELAVTDEPVEIDAATSTDDCDRDVPVVPEEFSIRDAKSASWLVRRVNEARRYSQQVAAWADKEKKRAERDEQFLLLRYGRQLEDWASGEITRLRGRRRSVCLPGGTVGFRKVGPTLVFDSIEHVLSWAKSSCPQAVVVKESVSKTTINEHVEATGELPDGAHVEEGRDKFYVS